MSRISCRTRAEVAESEQLIPVSVPGTEERHVAADAAETFLVVASQRDRFDPERRGFLDAFTNDVIEANSCHQRNFGPFTLFKLDVSSGSR